MKKWVLVLLTFVPVAAGYLLNLTILLPGMGGFLYYLLPIVISVFWIWLGGRFANASWKTVPALLIGNATGIVSLLVYLWQFLLESDATRVMVLAAASQMFSASAPYFLLARFALFFESEPNTITMASAVALQVLSVLYMVILFSTAFFLEKYRMNSASGE